MNSSPQWLSILALFITSLVVRILPVFIAFRAGKAMSETTRDLFERVLPLAVFLNFVVYIVWTEIRIAPAAAAMALAVAAIITLSTRGGLVLITFLSTAVYAAVETVFHF